MEMKSAYLLTFLICWEGGHHKMFPASFTPSGLSSLKKSALSLSATFSMFPLFPCT